MRKVLFLFFMLLGGFLSAQTLGDYEEVVYLKNGSIIRGIIVETIPNKSIKIQTHDNNILVYQFDEIEKIAKELPSGGGAHSSKRKDKGFNMYMDEGMALWIYGSDVYPMNILTATAGYKINHTIFIGAGIGFIARSGFGSVPVYVDARFTLGKSKVAPLINLQAGYMTRNLLADNASSGGFTFAFKPGIAINVKKDIDINFNTGYQLGSQIIKTDAVNYGFGYSTPASTNLGLMHFFVLTAGVKF